MVVSVTYLSRWSNLEVIALSYIMPPSYPPASSCRAISGIGWSDTRNSSMSMKTIQSTVGPKRLRASLWAAT